MQKSLSAHQSDAMAEPTPTDASLSKTKPNIGRPGPEAPPSWRQAATPPPDRPNPHYSLPVYTQKPMTLPAILSLALLSTAPVQNNQEKPWQYQPVGKTGLRLLLPEPLKSDPKTPEKFTLEVGGLKLVVTASKSNSESPLDTTGRYLETLGKFRTQYKDRVESILNEPDVESALKCGAEATIGFEMEVKGGQGAAIGWNLVRCNGYDYEILLEGLKGHLPAILTILDSQRYLDPTTNQFKSGPIGGLGIETTLGSGFWAPNGADNETATTLVLQGNNIPIAGAAQLWLPSDVDYSNAVSVQKAFAKQLSSTNVASNPNITVKESTRGDIKTYEMTGEVTVNLQKIECVGVAFVFGREAVSILAVYDPKNPEQAAIAKAIINNAKSTRQD